MKVIKNYYLIIPVDDIKIKIDTEKLTIIDRGLAGRVFDKYLIPKEYQKIILKVSMTNVLGYYELYELTTNKKFNFRTSLSRVLKMIKNNNDKLEIFSQGICIDTDSKFYRAESIKEFYKMIIDNNLASNYENAINDIISISIREKESNKVLIKNNTF